MYKGIIILYLVCFGTYVLFSRVPDYFEGAFVPGTVEDASFADGRNEPRLVVRYKVGSQAYHYYSSTWRISRYQKGEKVMMIFDPSQPDRSALYTFFGYWIKWPELFFTAGFFVVFFLAAKTITGKEEDLPKGQQPEYRKRKYKD